MTGITYNGIYCDVYEFEYKNFIKNELQLQNFTISRHEHRRHLSV